MKRITRQVPFLKAVLQEAQGHKRKELLHHANSDQINAVSEIVLNLLKQRLPVSTETIRRLKPHRRVLKELGKRSHSIKKRRKMMMEQKGRGLWCGLHQVCQSVGLY